MEYNFDKQIVRRGSNSFKWDFPPEGVLPMWVADMDFEIAPAITQAIRKRLEHPVFGYAFVPQSYYDSVIAWFDRRHHWKIEKEWILYMPGVIPSMSMVMRTLCEKGDKVLVLSPVYNHFYDAINNCDCEVLESSLIYANNTYTINYEDLDRKAADEKVKMLLFCNPHNPAGRVWTYDELKKVSDICLKHKIVLVSDEIHCELTMPDVEYCPFATVSEECFNNAIVFNSPSKPFNIAGLQISNIICKNPQLRNRLQATVTKYEFGMVNAIGIEALQAAYNEGAGWLDALRAYVADNYHCLCRFFAEKLPHIAITTMEGSYLVWANIKSLGMTSDEVCQRLLEQAKVMVSSGSMYSKKDGEGFIRINIACSRDRMMEGLNRMYEFLKK